MLAFFGEQQVRNKQLRVHLELQVSWGQGLSEAQVLDNKDFHAPMRGKKKIANINSDLISTYRD